MVRAGVPFELIARRLGHREVAMLAKVRRDHWEQVAGARDRENWSRDFPKDVATSRRDVEKQHECSTAS
jgi:glutamate formiminotransferase